MTDHYRQLLFDQTEYLTEQITKFTAILDTLTGDTVDTASPATSEQIESAIGRIHLAIGQSNLFIKERFKQFAGLIDDCEQKRGEKEIKVDDLAGFWDMIYYQVADLKTKYDQLEDLQKNDWVPVEEETHPSEANNNKAPTRRSVKAVAPTAFTKKPIRSNFRAFLKSKKKAENAEF